MIKKITTGILAVALTGSLYADNYSVGQKFIGVELGSTNLDRDVLVDSIESGPTSDSGIEYGFRIGAQNEEWRTTVLYTYYNDDDSVSEDTIHKGSLNLDYFIWSTDAGGMKIKPFIGGHVGYMSYEFFGDIYETNAPENRRVITADESGFFYGGQAGVALAIGEVVELDLFYRYSFTDVKDMPEKISLDNTGSIVLGLNYFF